MSGLRWFRDPDGDIGVSESGDWRGHVAIVWTDGAYAVARPPAPITRTVDFDHGERATQAEAVVAVADLVRQRFGAAVAECPPSLLMGGEQ